MIIVFFGTPNFALPALDRLFQEHELKVVVTRSDKPRGRNLKSKPSPVKSRTSELGIPILEPENLKEAGFLNTIMQIKPDAIVVAAYGRIIPKEILEIPGFGCINIHASLLPQFRGAAPIHRAIMAGMLKTGVTIMQMDEGLDTGDILKQTELEIEKQDNTATLSAKMSEIGADLIIETLMEVEEGRAAPRKQDESKASYAPLIDKKELEIDWRRQSDELVRQVQALAPRPGAHTWWREKRLKIKDAEESSAKGPGAGILVVENKTLTVGTGQGSLQINRLQLEGKKEMTSAEFIRGYHLKSGDRFTYGRNI